MVPPDPPVLEELALPADPLPAEVLVVPVLPPPLVLLVAALLLPPPPPLLEGLPVPPPLAVALVALLEPPASVVLGAGGSMAVADSSDPTSWTSTPPGPVRSTARTEPLVARHVPTAIWSGAPPARSLLPAPPLVLGSPVSPGVRGAAAVKNGLNPAEERSTRPVSSIWSTLSAVMVGAGPEIAPGNPGTPLHVPWGSTTALVPVPPAALVPDPPEPVEPEVPPAAADPLEGADVPLVALAAPVEPEARSRALLTHSGRAEVPGDEALVAAPVEPEGELPALVVTAATADPTGVEASVAEVVPVALLVGKEVTSAAAAGVLGEPSCALVVPMTAGWAMIPPALAGTDDEGNDKAPAVATLAAKPSMSAPRPVPVPAVAEASSAWPAGLAATWPAIWFTS